MNRCCVKKTGLFLGLYLSLILPSLGQVQKYFGTAGIFLYVAGVLLVFFVIYRCCLNKFLLRVTDKQVLFMALLTIICLAIIFFMVYPHINVQTPGRGSDRDEDVNIAATELLGFRYPYYQRTYLGNKISRFPGAIFLSIPFVLLGNQALQNFFWLFIFFVITASFLKNHRLALFLFWIILFLSPVVMHELLTGGDLLANTIYILSFIFFMVRSICTAGTKTAKKILAAVLLGLGLSSRANFILLLPLVFSALLQNADSRSALKYTGLAVFVFLAITLPFYLYDPSGFSPLYWQFSIIDRFNGILPFSGIILSVIGAIIALVLCLRDMNDNYPALLIHCALVMFFPILAVVILSSIKVGKLDLLMSGFGISFLFFSAPAFWYLFTQNMPLQNRR